MAAPGEIVDAALRSFAERGVFRAYSQISPTRFKMLWHRDREFELVLDLKRRTLTFPCVLPEVKARSSMDLEFREWVVERQNKELPEHRRIDREKCVLSCANTKGNLSVKLTLTDDDWDFGARKLVSLVHEVYLSFIHQGQYYTYIIEVFNLDPDHI